VKEKDYLNLPTGAASGSLEEERGDLEILWAGYGTGDRRREVTDLVASQVRGDQVGMRVSDGTMGGDPAPGLPKTLKVIYLWQGLRDECSGKRNPRYSLKNSGRNWPNDEQESVSHAPENFLPAMIGVGAGRRVAFRSSHRQACEESFCYSALISNGRASFKCFGRDSMSLSFRFDAAEALDNCRFSPLKR
jgi:hypothetical protein